MSAPVRTLPVLQNWDCHVTGTCCKEYRVTLSADEVARIEAQNWDQEKDLGGKAPLKRTGPPWSRKVQLNHHEDGSCVFLGPQGRCRMHERHGYESKPLPCRLFPFVLVPVSDHWRVGLRYACPSAAENKGRALPQHQEELLSFAAQLARRENLQTQPDGNLTPPPLMDNGEKLSWPSILRLVDGLMRLVRNRKDPFERRLRKALRVATDIRQARLQTIEGARLSELFDLLSTGAEADTPQTPMQISPPRWIGRILFRQAAALFSRKDHGPNRGLASKGRVALFGAAMRFARGSGPIPRLHGKLPEATFEQAEKPRGPLSQEVEEILERYYTIKIGSLQFCGPASFGLPFWEGFESLLLTYPILLWITRMYQGVAPTEAVMKALTIVDDHIGFNKVLASFRQRLSFRILSRTGELTRLIAWYSR